MFLIFLIFIIFLNTLASIGGLLMCLFPSDLVLLSSSWLEPKSQGKMETFIINVLLEELSTSSRFFISLFFLCYLLNKIFIFRSIRHCVDKSLSRISWAYWFKKVLYYQVALVYTLTRLVTNVSQVSCNLLLCDIGMRLHLFWEFLKEFLLSVCLL